MTKVLNEENVKQVLNSDGLAVIDVNAQWCGPCKRLAPIIEKLSEEYDGQVDFYTADVDENDTVTKEFGIRNIPVLLFLNDGHLFTKTVGGLKESEIKEKIDELINKTQEKDNFFEY